MNNYKIILIAYSKRKVLEEYKKLPYVYSISYSPWLASYEIIIDVNAEEKFYYDQKVINIIESILEKKH